MTEERSNGAFRRPVTLLRPHLPVNRLDNLEFQIRRIRSPPFAHVPRRSHCGRFGYERGFAHADACAIWLLPANLEFVLAWLHYATFAFWVRYSVGHLVRDLFVIEFAQLGVLDRHLSEVVGKTCVTECCTFPSYFVHIGLL